MYAVDGQEVIICRHRNCQRALYGEVIEGLVTCLYQRQRKAISADYNHGIDEGEKISLGKANRTGMKYYYWSDKLQLKLKKIRRSWVALEDNLEYRLLSSLQ